jgi:hypothetical protein
MQSKYIPIAWEFYSIRYKEIERTKKKAPAINRGLSLLRLEP